MTESERLIAETLRLDAEAEIAAKEWSTKARTFSSFAPFEDRAANHIATAPRLARMLEVALLALNQLALDSIEADDALAEIEQIAKGESNGD